jgi:beta-glucosidase
VPGTWNRGDYYAGGGSGHVVGAYVVTPFDGIRQRATLEGIKVISSGSDDVNSAVNAAKQADITIVVVATTSGEASDRNHLDLDNARNLIPPVAKAAKKTVVITQMPGSSLMTWRDSVAAIATMFLGGQETGNAWASVLFGDHAPTGRLPVMIPESEADTIMPGRGTITCSEGMATSYRNQHFKAAFPFGHGLTYTKFQYGKPRAVGCSRNLCISVDVQNVGQVAAKEVAQLYLEFPTEAGYPAPLLKGFVKSSVIKPGEASKVTFVLLPRDVSYYDHGAWIKAKKVVAHIGASSYDIRVNLTTSTDASEVEVIV